MRVAVLGIAMTARRDRVVLTRGRRRGALLQAVAGRVLYDESPIDAMVRAFHEETDVMVPEDDWTMYVRVLGVGWQCYVYRAATDAVVDARAMGDDKVLIKTVYGSLDNCMSYLPWLLELARDPGADGAIATVDYRHMPPTRERAIEWTGAVEKIN